MHLFHVPLDNEPPCAWERTMNGAIAQRADGSAHSKATMLTLIVKRLSRHKRFRLKLLRFAVLEDGLARVR